MAYLPLSTANLPDPVINPAQGSSPADYFGIDTYAGNGGTIDSDFGFDCDLVWYKNRSRANTYHYLFDQVRGDDLPLYSNDVFLEDSQFPTYHTQSFITNGSRIVRTNGDHLNFSGDSYVAWAWKAGTAVSGTTTGSGTLKSYTGSVNTASGFSIIAYEGNSTAGHEIPHHLDQAPELIINKNRDTTNYWNVYTSVYGGSYTLYLNVTNTIAGPNSVWWNGTDPSSTVFTLGNNVTNNATGNDYISYCFHSVEGFSKFGSYVGNGDPDGPFVYTGFRPAFVMIKNTTYADQWWLLLDSERSASNVMADTLFPNIPNAEQDNDRLDFVSNGFKLRNTYENQNRSGDTFIYMAFAENPFKYSNAR